jgi:hypothetical protein
MAMDNINIKMGMYIKEIGYRTQNVTVIASLNSLQGQLIKEV